MKHYLVKNEKGHLAYYSSEGALTATWCEKHPRKPYALKQILNKMDADADELVEKDIPGVEFPKKLPKAPKAAPKAKEPEA